MGDNLKGAGAADALRDDHGYDTNRALDGTVYLVKKDQPDYKAAQARGFDKTSAGISATADVLMRSAKDNLNKAQEIRDRRKK